MKSVLIASSILIFLIAALRPLLRGRIDPRIQYALWAVVVLRLLVPVELASSAFSALALLERAEAPAQVAQAIGQTTVPILAMSPESATIQASQEYGEHDGVIRFDPSKQVRDRAEELMRGPTLSELAETYARPVWLGGMAVMAAWFLLVDLRLRRKLRRALPVDADCPLPVRVTPELPSPCLHGAFRPAVYVTPAALAGPDRMRHVLTHELTHWRHRDHWWALVRCLCLCVYWFDPLVWWAAAMSRQDCELACDEGAIRRLGEPERIAYGRTLVAMIAAGRTPLLQTATTMTGSKRRVRERVRLIARRPRTVIALALALTAVVGLAVGFTFTGAPGAQTLSTLQQRLEDLPEELRDDVKVSSLSAWGNGGTLVRYHVPAALWGDSGDGQDQTYWTLTVSRWSQARFDAQGWPDDNDTTGHEMFAQGDGCYYSIDRPLDALMDRYGWEPYRDIFDAVQAFAMQTVLDTEGVEPFGGTGGTLSADTLTTRLLTVPETLGLPPVNVYHYDDYDPDCLAAYWLSDPKWTDLWSGYLMNLYRMDGAQIQEQMDRQLWPAVDIFARDGDQYYAIIWPNDGRYQDGSELSDEYWHAVNTIKDYVKAAVLATQGVEPYTYDPYAFAAAYGSGSVSAAPESDPVQTAVDQLMEAPFVELQLSLYQDDLGYRTSYVWPSVPGQDFNASYLQDLPAAFSWEEFDWGTTEDYHLPDPPPTSSYLRIRSSDSSTYVHVYEDLDLVAVHDSVNGTNWYHANYDHDAVREISAFGYLRRNWFDVLELDCLRASAITVPDQGRSHEEIARIWAQGWEGALYRTAPDSIYACTYAEVVDVTADLPDWMDADGLADFATAHGMPAGGFGTDWFGFSYQAVVVPVDQTTASPFWAGNTERYEGDDAPEGALTYSRVGILHRTSQGWVCEGAGPGW